MPSSSQHGQISIQASLLESRNEHLLVQISVSDTGVGIAAEALDRIFDPFTQADASTSRKFGGTGLGLAICRQLAELMGGGIRVESEEGKGSRFHLRLPFKRPGEPEKRSSDHQLPDHPLPHRKPLKILVAEDNPLNLRAAELLLQKADIILSAQKTANRPWTLAKGRYRSDPDGSAYAL